jgi:hypothetical protein
MQVLSILSVLVLFVQTLAYTSPPNVNMNSAVSYAMIASSTITTIGTTRVIGDIALMPGTSITGFPPGTVVGTTHIADSQAMQAKADLETASVDAESRPSDQTLNGDAGGMTLTPGVYTSDSSLKITGTLGLNCQGSPLQSVWIFQISSTLTLETGAIVEFVNCLSTSTPKAYWNVGSAATINGDATMIGTIMSYSAITVVAGARTGALMSREAAITLDTNYVTEPSSTLILPTPSDDVNTDPVDTNSAGSGDSSVTTSSGFKAGIAIASVAVFLSLVAAGYCVFGRGEKKV